MIDINSKTTIPDQEKILLAYDKLFTDGQPDVSHFPSSGLRYLKLSEGVILVEQNPAKQSQWAKLVRAGHRVAWVMWNGKYIIRVVDGEIENLDQS